MPGSSRETIAGWRWPLVCVLIACGESSPNPPLGPTPTSSKVLLKGSSSPPPSYLTCEEARGTTRVVGARICLRGTVSQTDGSVNICDTLGAWDFIPGVRERLEAEVLAECPKCTDIRELGDATFELEGCFVWAQRPAVRLEDYRIDRWHLAPADGRLPSVTRILTAAMSAQLPGHVTPLFGTLSEFRAGEWKGVAASEPPPN